MIFYVTEEGRMNECPVCLEEMERAVWCTMPCAHHICFPCLLRMWEHSSRSCPLCRRSMSDCLPPCRNKVRRIEDLETMTDEAFERIVRRMQVTHVMENGLRATPPIAPRNALARSRSLRIVTPQEEAEDGT